MSGAIAWFREYAPCEALRDCVRSFFCLSPLPDAPPAGRNLLSLRRVGDDGPCAPPLADGHSSLVFCFDNAYVYGRGWHSGAPPRGLVIGPVSSPGSNSPAGIPERVGVSLRAGRTAALLGVPGVELANRSLAIEDLWGPAAAALAPDFAELPEASRIDRLESLLLRRVNRQPPPAATLNVPELARQVLISNGSVRIDDLARQAGVSRQHLTRSFRDAVGITPKLFARLARFHAGLAYAGAGQVDWAQAALALGYTDQSHMIAEFREFSSLTPDILAARNWFHPFIHRARRRRNSPLFPENRARASEIA